MNVKERLRAAARFALKHLAVSALIAAICAALVFAVWYPYPYSELASGRELFALVVSVDVVVGPLLSFAVFNPSKPRAELWRDLGIIFILQLSALFYGMYSVTQARPVWLAFEGDRFRIVAVPDVDANDISRAPEGLQNYSWIGPKTVGVRLLANTDLEFSKSIQLAMEGVHAAFRPERWVPYDSQRELAIKEAKPLSKLRQKFPSEASVIDEVVARSGHSESSLGYLPLASQHRTDWSVVINLKDGVPIDFLPLDAWD
jgi:hypothetical protein